MAKKSKLIFIGITIIFSFLFVKCANQLPPGGGEIDTIPPKIIEVIPSDGTTQYKENYFEITFSEYVEKRSVQNAIFISPSVQKGFKYDWTGKTLTVYFKDSLKKNTTYTITIGTDAKDINNGNKMAEPFTFVFSTGNKIDKGKIAGKIYDPSPDGVMIFAYQKNEKEIDPSKEKPDFISQVGKNGKYTLVGLSDSAYEIFAFRDRLRDLLYQKNEDEVGVQSKKIELSDQQNEVANIDFFLTKDDTIPPRISNVFMKDKHRLAVEFTKSVDSTKLSAKDFYVVDTLNNKKVLAKYFFKGDSKQNQFYVVFMDSLDVKGDWVLAAEKFEDLKGNKNENERIPFLIKTDRDTTRLKVGRVYGNPPDGKIDYEKPEINLTFSNAIDSVLVKEKTSLTDAKGNDYPFILKKIDDASYIVNVESKLKQGEDYTLKVDLKNYYDLNGNKVDSVFKSKVTTSNELDFSGASGTVSGLADSSAVIVVLQNTIRENKSYTGELGTKRTFNFNKVVPGKYLLWGFIDRNNNKKYDFGTVKPFTYSEEFKFYPDTLNLRARWPVGDLNISFDK
ncbi:MAG: Ig-like domain-containing protein [Bacteroidetes bacterium]|nr:Ig-like domain-containing protein [Bacteroidota bacterium]